jgi:hypothetical protein
MSVAVFNPAIFLGRYPEFTATYNKSIAPYGSQTIVIAILGGAPGTNVPAGSLAIDLSGFIYSLQGAVTLGSDGGWSATFANVSPGALPCPAGSLTQIYQGVAGWNTVSNPTAGILGTVSNPWLFPNFFAEAGLYLNNTDCSIVQDVNLRTVLLNMLTAHIAFLNGQLSADNQVRPVGRMSAASEGAVSASFEGVPPTPGTGEWFQQSQYGASFWQATISYRGARYFPNPTRVEGFTGTRYGRY